ncbi:hypothetical protein CDAR_379571 [Caerostris darwini]|uniref:Uncharacterized protein n=1 Tax=Caerostris darwini TaxID=1538125 RepID=A0AAV4RN25_9ARAC|nr:hypothetical protein CDAR_379571 [Caerostris darwini]
MCVKLALGLQQKLPATTSPLSKQTDFQNEPVPSFQSSLERNILQNRFFLLGRERMGGWWGRKMLSWRLVFGIDPGFINGADFCPSPGRGEKGF